MIKKLFDYAVGKAPLKAARSTQWPKCRKAFLALNPRCSVCNGTAKLEVHHISPFHLAAHLELEPANLITLCEAKRYGLNCHLAIGHLGNYRRINDMVRRDVAYWRRKLNGGKA